MPDHEDSLGGEAFSGEEQQDPAEQSLGDGATMGGDTAAHSLGDQSTFGDANVDDELFDDGMELVDLSTRYTEEGVLGKGGMGEVILATDTRLGRKVAIKRILGKAARSKTAVQRFLTEAQSMAELSHPNIVQIYDYGRSTDGPFLIMECVQGGSLLEKCKAGPIELDEAVNIFGQLCDGLAKAHAAGIIHRDIKPANVLMTEDGVPKLTDFGLAKDDTADTGMTMEGAVIGTLDFMPPEQRQAAELTDHRSDLWSLAATFYQMLTGKSPMIIKFSDVPTQLHDALGKALEDDKEERFQSAMEMREAIIQAHSGKMDTSRSLGEGECPQCATPNPSGNKYCDECGTSLLVSCLNCESDIAIWNKACRECGTQQDPLVKHALKALEAKHDEAEQFLSELKFDDALKASSVIGEQNDPRLLQFATWQEEFLARLKASQASEHARLEQLLREALAHEQAYDYEAGLKALQQIAAPLQQTTLTGIKGTAKEITKRLTTNQSRLKELEGIVRERVSKRKIAGLLTIVNELLTLKPDRPEVQKLKAQLATREDNLLKARDTAIDKAAQQLSEQKYAEAVATLDAVSAEVSSEQLENLKTKANDLLNQLDKLRNIIAATISTNQFENLLPVVEKCLVLKADQVEIVKLKQDLIKRESQLDARNHQIISKAQSHIQQLQFDEAVQILSTIASKQRTSSTVAISQRAAAEILARAPITNVAGMTLNFIPTGTFMMGSPETEGGREEYEHQHQVTISKTFYMQTTEVTQGQWTAVMGTEPWKGERSVKEGPDYPAVYVSWNDAVAYCEKLSEKEGGSYRLPTEAEWEYACRGGTQTTWSFGSREKALRDCGWYFTNAFDIGNKYAHRVGLKKPNPVGLYDMHGNVREWCNDIYAKDYYEHSPIDDPTGSVSGIRRVMRGGGWNSMSHHTRSAYRNSGVEDCSLGFLGFRVVRELD